MALQFIQSLPKKQAPQITITEAVHALRQHGFQIIHWDHHMKAKEVQKVGLSLEWFSKDKVHDTTAVGEFVAAWVGKI